MKLNLKKYFESETNPFLSVVRYFIIAVLLFSIIFFIWSVMKYNRMQDEKADKEEYINQLSEKIDELEYLVDMPLDDEYKIRISREKLGMCFADEIIFYTDIE